MFDEIFDKVAGLFRKEDPITVEVDGKNYAIKSDRTLGEFVRPPAPLAKPTLILKTLTGLCAAYEAKLDEFPEEVALQVESFDSVALVSLRADEFGRRHVWARTKSENENPFRFGVYYAIEDFIIALQSSFLPSDNVSALTAMCSSVTAGSSVQVADDGISMVVTVQEGAMTRGNVNVPNRLPLAPYRTFREIDPVASDFLFRMKPVKDGLPTATLLEVDGGKWKLDTVLAISSYLSLALPEATVIA